MKFIDEYRTPEVLKIQLGLLRAKVCQRWVIMDVCGGQTHSLLRHGLEEELLDDLELVHGPGCPVCVTPSEVIDDAITLAQKDGLILASFGDMLRVPGGRGSLLKARADGADVRMVYSPVDAVQLAMREPDRSVVFFGVGFETTAPATALAVLQAQQRGVRNFSVLAHHVRVEPAMRVVMKMPQNRVQGFLAAGHVCTVTGFDHYEAFVSEFQVPVVVTGFEPLDLLLGLTACVDALENQRPRVINQYARTVRADGNAHARRLINQVYRIATVPWRGFGEILDGGLVMRDEVREFDARYRFGLTSSAASIDGECRSAEVMTGRIKPPQCPLFGNGCTPDRPMGAPMVSSEGACAAYFLYSKRSELHRD